MKLIFEKLLAVVFLSAVAFPLMAGPVSPERATSVAGTVLKRSPEKLRLVHDALPATKGMTASPSYYLFNAKDRPGFVIVSGDDALSPVIAYSDESDFVLDESQTNVMGWLGMWDEIVTDVRRRGVRASASVEKDWKDFEHGKSYADEGSGKLIETALWDQGEPYNRECPYFDGRTITGCVATAACIVMRYHKWPEKGIGTIPGYSFSGENDILREVPDQPLGRTYEWDKMPLRYSSSSTEEEKNAVAVLMHDVGVMVRAGYGVGSTGAHTGNVATGYIEYMDYDPALIYLVKKYVNGDTWMGMIKDNIDNYGPIVYSGSNSSGGHAFVLDGYNAQGQIHINWGWSGHNNGYYTFPQFDVYTKEHAAVFNVRPDCGGKLTTYLAIDGGGAGRGMKASVSAFYPGTTFDVEIDNVQEMGMTSFTGDIALVHVNGEGRIVEVLDTITGISFSSSGFKVLTYENVTVNEISLGDKLRLAYRDAGESEWRLMEWNMQNGTSGLIKLADEQSIGETTSVEYSSVDSKMLITTKKGVNYSITDRKGAVIAKGVTYDNGEVITVDCGKMARDIYTLTLEKTIEKQQINLKIGKL